MQLFGQARVKNAIILFHFISGRRSRYNVIMNWTLLNLNKFLDALRNLFKKKMSASFSKPIEQDIADCGRFGVWKNLTDFGRVMQFLTFVDQID